MITPSKNPFDRIVSDKFDPGQSPDALAREQIHQEFKKKRAILMGITWGFTLFEAAQMLLFVIIFLFTDNTKLLIALAALFIVSFQTTILMKLWYWIVHTRIILIREMKETRVELAELAEKIRPPLD